MVKDGMRMGCFEGLERSLRCGRVLSIACGIVGPNDAKNSVVKQAKPIKAKMSEMGLYQTL